MVFLACRLVDGKDVKVICQALRAKAQQLRPGPELAALQAWTWQFAFHVLYQVGKVCIAAFSAVQCCC